MDRFNYYVSMWVVDGAKMGPVSFPICFKEKICSRNIKEVEEELKEQMRIKFGPEVQSLLLSFSEI